MTAWRCLPSRSTRGEILLASLEDPPDALAELRAVLLNEHEWRQGLVSRPAHPRERQRLSLLPCRHTCRTTSRADRHRRSLRYSCGSALGMTAIIPSYVSGPNIGEAQASTFFDHQTHHPSNSVPVYLRAPKRNAMRDADLSTIHFYSSSLAHTLLIVRRPQES